MQATFCILDPYTQLITQSSINYVKVPKVIKLKMQASNIAVDLPVYDELKP